MKRFLLIPFLLFLSSCNYEQEENIPYIKALKVTETGVSDNKTYIGYIKRGSDVELSFTLSGILISKKNEGYQAKKGDLLAELDSDEYRLNVQKAKLELENANILNERAKSYFERISKLYKAGGISYNDWEAAQTDLKSSANKIRMLSDAVKIAMKQENYTKIFAPYNGVVIRTYKDPHQFAPAGEKIIYFQGKDGLEGRIFASQKDIGEIKQGQEVLIFADAIQDKQFLGSIKSKINSSLNKGSYEVKIAFSENYPELLDGMSINVSVKNDKDYKEILIPVSSVVTLGGKSFVYILNKNDNESGVISKREILTGEIKGEFVQIKSGLHGGEYIVADGANKVMDGIKVRYYD